MGFVLLDISPEAAGGGMAGALVGLITLVVAVGKYALERQRKKDMAAVGPVAPMPHPLPATPMPPELAEAIRAMTRWNDEQFRARIRQLESLEVLLRNEIAHLRHDLEDSNAENLRLSAAMASMNGTVETLAREREAADVRAQLMAAELADVKREIASGHHGSAAVTPMRPGPRKP